MKKMVVIDLDGTLFDICSVIAERLDFKVKDIKTYDFNKSLDKGCVGCEGIVSLDDKRAEIFSLLESADIFVEAPQVSDFVGSLKRLLSDETVEVVFNSCVSTKNSASIVQAKVDRLNELFSDYSYKVEITIGYTKPVFSDAYVVIDDSLDYLKGYIGSSVIPCLVDQPYNQLQYNKEYEDVINGCVRVRGVEEVVENLYGVSDISYK